MSNFVCLNVDVPADLIPDTYTLLNAMEEDGYVNCLPLIVHDERYICTLASVDKCKKLEHCKFVNDDKLYYNFYYKININNPSFYGDLYPIKAVIQLKEDLTRARHEDIVLELEHLVNLLSPYNFITFTDKDIEDMRYEYCKWKKLKPVKRKPYTTSMFWWDLMNKPSDMRINKKDENKGDE